MQLVEKSKVGARRTAAAVVALPMVLGMAFLMAGPASAQAADPVSGAFADAGTKVATYGGLAVALIVTGLVIWLGVKYVTKGVAKA